LIPEKFWGELYYADRYKEFLDRDFPNKASEDVPNDQRIVMPCINPDNYISYVTGRFLGAYTLDGVRHVTLSNNSHIRYVTIKILDQKKIFGENRLDSNKDFPVFITEGPIDSFFLPNAVASADANLLGVAHYLRTKGYTDITLVYDNEPRNRHIVRMMEKTIESDFKIVIQPHGKTKDLNLMAMEGMPLEKILSYIQKHTYKGPVASLILSQWRRTT